MTEPIAPAPTVIAPEPGSRLEALAEAYAAAKPAADEAKARLDMITDAIKYELTQAAPGADKVDLQAPNLLAPLRLSARTSWRLDTTKLKAEAPETYARYAKQTSYWELRALGSRGGTP
jgi:hypothetical protein